MGELEPTGTGPEQDKNKESVLEELKKALQEMLRKLREKLNRPAENRPEKPRNLDDKDIPPLKKAYERIVAAEKKVAVSTEPPPEKEQLKTELEEAKGKNPLLKKVDIAVVAESPRAAQIIVEATKLSDEARNDPAYWIAKQAELPQITSETSDAESQAINAAKQFIQKQLNKALDTNPPYREEYQHIHKQMTSGTPRTLETIVEDLGGQSPPAVEQLEQAASVQPVDSPKRPDAPPVVDQTPPPPPPEKPFAERLADMTPYELKEEYKRLTRQRFMLKSKMDQVRLPDENSITQLIEEKIMLIKKEMEHHVNQFSQTQIGKDVMNQLRADTEMLSASTSQGGPETGMYTKIWESMREFRVRELNGEGNFPKELEGLSEYVYLDLLGEYGVEKANMEAIFSVMKVANVSELKAATMAQFKALGLDKTVTVEVRKDWGPKLNGGKGDWIYESQTIEDYLNKINLETSKGWGEAVSDLILRDRQAAEKFMGDMDPARREQFRSMYIHPEDQKRFQETIINAVVNGEDIEKALKLWMQETINSLMVATHEPIRAHPESQQRLTGLMFLISDIDPRYLKDNFKNLADPKTGQIVVDYVRLAGADRIREQLINRLGAAEDFYNAGYMQTTGGALAFKDMVQVIHRMQFREGMNELFYETKDRWGNRTVAEGWRFINKHLDDIIGKNVGEGVRHKLQFQFMKKLYGQSDSTRKLLTFSDRELGNQSVANSLKVLKEGSLHLTDEQIASWWNLDETRFADAELQALMDLMQMKDGTLSIQYRAASYGLKMGEAVGYVFLENHARQYDGGFSDDGQGADWARRLFRPTYWMMRWGMGGNLQHDQVLIKRKHWQTYDLVAKKMEKRDLLEKLLAGKHVEPQDLRRIKHHELEHLEKIHEADLKKQSQEQKDEKPLSRLRLQDELDKLNEQKLPKDFIDIARQYPHWVETSFEVSPTRIMAAEGHRFEGDFTLNNAYTRNAELAMNKDFEAETGVRALDPEKAKFGAEIKKYRIENFTLSPNSRFRNEHAHAFVRTKTEHNAQMYGYYKVYQHLLNERLTPEQLEAIGISGGKLTYKSVAEMDFAKSNGLGRKDYQLYKETFERTMAGKHVEGDVEIKGGLNGPDRLIQEFRNRLYRGTEAEKRAAEDFMKNSGFVVEYAETVAPLEKVRMEYMNWNSAPEDFVRRAYRDNDGVSTHFHEAILQVVGKAGERPEVLAKALEMLDRGPGWKGHLGTEAHQKRVAAIVSLALSLHKTRVAVRGEGHILWSGLLPWNWGSNGWMGRRNMEEWEYKIPDPEIDLYGIGTQQEIDARNQERFSHIPLVGSLFRDDDGVPLFQRSEVSERTNEPAWTRNEVWHLLHHLVENGQINAKNEHWLRAQHKGQVSEIGAALEDAFSPLNIFAGSFEMLKKFKQDVDRAFDGGGGSSGGHH